MKHGEEIKLKMLNAGIEAWLKDPATVTYSQIARMVDMRHGSVFYHFPNNTLRAKIAEYAVSIKHSEMLPILIAARNPAVSSLTPAERADYLQALSI